MCSPKPIPSIHDARIALCLRVVLRAPLDHHFELPFLEVQGSLLRGGDACYRTLKINAV